MINSEIGERITRISAESSARFIGHNVRVLLGNGKVRNGKITSVQQDRLSMQYTIGNKTIGSMSYELSYKDIKSIEIIS